MATQEGHPRGHRAGRVRQDAPGGEHDWHVLDRVLRDMEGCEGTTGLVRRLVRAARALTSADAVYATSPEADGPFEALADRALPPDLCRRFLRRQLRVAEAGGGHVAGAAVGFGPGASAVLVPLSRSVPLWLVVVRFRRALGVTDLRALQVLRRIFRTQHRRLRSREKLTAAVLGVVHGLNAAITAKCPFTSGHSERVARMAVSLGRQLELPPATLGDLRLAGLLHDVGKIAVRDSVLQKPGPLTPEEEAHVREHPVVGDLIVAKVPELTHLRGGVRGHHERFDGHGYPDGLAGETIPLLARVLAVADACDAMLSARPYRPGLPAGRVERVMLEGAGRQWDSAVVTAFHACRHELYGIHASGLGDSLVHAVGEVLRARQED